MPTLIWGYVNIHFFFQALLCPIPRKHQYSQKHTPSPPWPCLQNARVHAKLLTSLRFLPARPDAPGRGRGGARHTAGLGERGGRGKHFAPTSRCQGAPWTGGPGGRSRAEQGGTGRNRVGVGRNRVEWVGVGGVRGLVFMAGGCGGSGSGAERGVYRLDTPEASPSRDTEILCNTSNPRSKENAHGCSSLSSMSQWKLQASSGFFRCFPCPSNKCIATSN